MKNIHILPTDKPSSLYILGNNELKLRYTIDLPIDPDIAVNLHIYITSDEEIKVGDFVYSKRGFIGKFGEFENSYFDECKKIILTTDQSLIQDGVQAIDDEFLEWFVKNPSCEEVDINRDWGYPKIIIPKEEPTQELHSMDDEVECNNCGNIMSLLEDESNYACFNSECTRCYEEYEEEPKQETQNL